MLFRISAEVRALRNTDGFTPAVVSRLANLENQVAEATAALRDALMALHEAAGEHELAVAVQGDCRAFEERTGVSASAVQLDDIPQLDHQRQHVLRRVAREALLNVEKHARAESVVVSMGRLDGGVILVVTDDGVGMPQAAELDACIGLASLESSVVQVGGTFRVVSGDEGGTTVQAWVPCL
jgi:signal transduction histidine kinase